MTYKIRCFKQYFTNNLIYAKIEIKMYHNVQNTRRKASSSRRKLQVFYIQGRLMLCFPSLLYLLFKLNNCRCFISDHLFIYKIYNLLQQKMCISSTYITHQIKQKTRNSFFHLRFLLTKTIGNQRRRLLEKSRWKEYEIWKDFHIFSWKDLNNYWVVLYWPHMERNFESSRFQFVCYVSNIW